jgi:hypothetical protein
MRPTSIDEWRTNGYCGSHERVLRQLRDLLSGHRGPLGVEVVGGVALVIEHLVVDETLGLDDPQGPYVGGPFLVAEVPPEADQLGELPADRVVVHEVAVVARRIRPPAAFCHRVDDRGLWYARLGVADAVADVVGRSVQRFEDAGDEVGGDHVVVPQ